MSGKAPQTKGKTGERELARILRDLLAPESENPNFFVERTGHQQAHVGGFDILIPKLGIEVKRAKRVSDGLVKAWWEETVIQSASAGKIGVLAYRQDNQTWKVVVPGHHIDENGRTQLHSFLELTETLFLPGFFRWYLMHLDVAAYPKIQATAADPKPMETH